MGMGMGGEDAELEMFAQSMREDGSSEEEIAMFMAQIKQSGGIGNFMASMGMGGGGMAGMMGGMMGGMPDMDNMTEEDMMAAMGGMGGKGPMGGMGGMGAMFSAMGGSSGGASKKKTRVKFKRPSENHSTAPPRKAMLTLYAVLLLTGLSHKISLTSATIWISRHSPGLAVLAVYPAFRPFLRRVRPSTAVLT